MSATRALRRDIALDPAAHDTDEPTRSVSTVQTQGDDMGDKGPGSKSKATKKKKLKKDAAKSGTKKT